ncbi:MAG: hypothetical protein WAV20_06460, partial [Blastocatellia bacterium]
MIKMQKIAPGFVVGLLAAAMCGAAYAQQGWAQLQTIKQGGGAASINSVFYDGDEIWLVGAHGLIARSHDEGQTLQEMNQGVDTGLNDVYIRKDRMCIVGDAGTILRSTDGGRSFVKVLRPSKAGRTGAPDEPDLYSVQFADEDHVYVVGDRGLILASSDAGVSWREQQSGSDAQ